VSLTFATSATASLATSLLSAVYAAAAAGTLNSANEFVVTTPGAKTIPAGVSTVVDAATGAVTLTGSGNYSVVAGAGNLEFLATGGSGTIVAGAGSDTFVGSNYALLGDATTTGYIGGSDTVTSGNFVLTGTAASVVAAGASATITGSGSTTNSASYNNVITNVGTGPNTFVIAAGSTTVNAVSGGGAYFEELGQLLFLNGGASTVVGSSTSGTATLFGGNAALTYFQGLSSAPVTFVGGAGTSYLASAGAGGIAAFGGAGGTINLINAAPNTAFNYLIGGTGAETLNAALASGNTAVYAGSGNDAVFLSNTSGDLFSAGSGSATVVGGTVAAGSGTAALPDIFTFANGSAGGSDVILNFGAASELSFSGYGAGGAAIKAALIGAGSGSTVSFTLPDNTKVTLVGINGSTINPSSNTTIFS
jgi:hypothetical protein